jgi:predicted NBD/HSP70 family sugar kinase
MYLLFDIGGTKTRIAFSDGETLSTEPTVISTPTDFEEGIETLKREAEKIAAGRHVVAAAGGVPGPLDDTRDQLLNAPNLSGWVGKPLCTRLKEVLGVPVFLENDTALVGLGEATAGAGKDNRIVTYLTISTGVGGVRIVEEHIDQKSVGFEPGHQIIDLDKTACPNCVPCAICGDTVDLESMISGSAVKRRFGKEPYDIAQNDPLWEELAEWLAIGLHNTILHWSPDAVVLGGSMMVGDPNIPIDRVHFHLGRLLKIFPRTPKILRATLKDFGGLHGALAHVRYKTHK